VRFEPGEDSAKRRVRPEIWVVERIARIDSTCFEAGADQVHRLIVVTK